MARIRQLIPRLDLHTEEDDGQFAGCWELELLHGESTDPHEHREREEVCYVLLGAGAILIGGNRGAIRKGDLVHVPPSTSHRIENDASRRLRCLLVASEVPPPPTEETPERKTIAEIDAVMGRLPPAVNEAAAIRGIVSLFDIGGSLSEQIENAFGLDNTEGVDALARIEEKIMRAVVEITRRYSLGKRGFRPI